MTDLAFQKTRRGLKRAIKYASHHRKLSIQVRTALPGHMERVKRLQWEVFPEDLPIEFNVSRTIVALRGKEIVGFAYATDRGFIIRYGVAQYERLQGVGERMIGALENQMRNLGYKRLFTYIKAWNPSSINVFIKCDWRAYLPDYAEDRDSVFFEIRL